MTASLHDKSTNGHIGFPTLYPQHEAARRRFHGSVPRRVPYLSERDWFWRLACISRSESETVPGFQPHTRHLIFIPIIHNRFRPHQSSLSHEWIYNCAISIQLQGDWRKLCWGVTFVQSPDRRLVFSVTCRSLSTSNFQSWSNQEM